MMRCSSFGLRMYKSKTTKGAEHNDPAMINAPSNGPKSPSRSPSRNPAAMRTTNCASTQSRMTIPSIRPTLDHLDSDCRCDVDDVIEACMNDERDWTYMKHREESRSVRPSVFTETAVGFEHSSLRGCPSSLHSISVR